MKLYVVTAPPSRRGVYDSWSACEGAVAGVRGARYQSATSREQAEAVLRGESVVLPPGVYVFIDGNERGGVGVVFVKQRTGAQPLIREVSTSVLRVFDGSPIPGIDHRAGILGALGQLRNTLGELAALYYVIGRIVPQTSFTLVYDFNGIAEWMQGRWRMQDEVVRDIIGACQRAVIARELRITYRHQSGRQPISFNEFARYNARADALATESAHVWV